MGVNLKTTHILVTTVNHFILLSEKGLLHYLVGCCILLQCIRGTPSGLLSRDIYPDTDSLICNSLDDLRTVRLWLSLYYTLNCKTISLICTNVNNTQLTVNTQPVSDLGSRPWVSFGATSPSWKLWSSDTWSYQKVHFTTQGVLLSTSTHPGHLIFAIFYTVHGYTHV